MVQQGAGLLLLLGGRDDAWLHKLLGVVALLPGCRRSPPPWGPQREGQVAVEVGAAGATLLQHTGGGSSDDLAQCPIMR
jgi:hypothetical protein